MSTTFGAFRHAASAATWIRERTSSNTASEPAKIADNAMSWGLARQIFFPRAGVARSRVLFAGAGSETNISGFCKNLGTTLAEITGGMVAVVEESRGSEIFLSEESARNRGNADFWQSCSSQVSERVWSVPSAIFSGKCSPSLPDWTTADVKEIDATFAYVLFACRINNSETQLFSGMCDAAVLVLTANRTRREVALRAKEELLRLNVPLLGAVLDQRKFPIPEAIYRRL